MTSPIADRWSLGNTMLTDRSRPTLRACASQVVTGNHVHNMNDNLFRSEEINLAFPGQSPGTDAPLATAAPPVLLCAALLTPWPIFGARARARVCRTQRTSAT